MNILSYGSAQSNPPPPAPPPMGIVQQARAHDAVRALYRLKATEIRDLMVHLSGQLEAHAARYGARAWDMAAVGQLSDVAGDLRRVVSFLDGVEARTAARGGAR